VTAQPMPPCDVLVYGSTSGGVAAAVQAARSGLQVVLACPKHHPGGMTASGLCTMDAVRKSMWGGLVRELVDGIRAHYLSELGPEHPEFALCRDGWHMEPSVAEGWFRALIENETGLRWLPGHQLESVQVEGRRLASARLCSEGGDRTEIRAASFIDGTYEADLAAAAGVGYRVGREGADEYGESLAGIRYIDWRTGEEHLRPESGEPSPAIQAFCARSILTDDPAHRVPIERPADYGLHLPDYLPLLDDFASGRVTGLGHIMPGARLPGGKREVNGHIEALTSANCPGVNWGYPEARPGQRQVLDRFHVEHVAGLVYFLQTHPGVPPRITEAIRPFGLHDEEFADSGHWPWQLYVRQGRRIQGRETVTQHSFTPDPATGRTPAAPMPIALGEHSFDIHPCCDRRFGVGGLMEGVHWYPRKAAGPAQPGQIPYGAMVPLTVDNLLVPVGMSSTHIAMSVLRMEPVWMTTGQVAGLAAAAARQQGVAVADVDARPLPARAGIETDPQVAAAETSAAISPP